MRCHIQNKMCSLIIDSESYVNVARTTLINKLNLCMIKQNRPYRLKLLNDYGEVKVTKQVLASFLIRKLVDKVLCDIVSMYASHILLGRP